MGENILIVHGGGPTSVINASLYGAVKEAKKYKEIEHIYAAKNGTGGLMREELIELENVPDEKLELLLNTPGSAIGTSRDQIEQAEYDRMIEVLLKKNIMGILSLFVIFGIPIMVLAAGFIVWFRRRRA